MKMKEIKFNALELLTFRVIEMCEKIDGLLYNSNGNSELENKIKDYTHRITKNYCTRLDLEEWALELEDDLVEAQHIHDEYWHDYEIINNRKILKDRYVN